MMLTRGVLGALGRFRAPQAYGIYSMAAPQSAVGHRRSYSSRLDCFIQPPTNERELGVGWEDNFREQIDRVISNWRLRQYHVPLVVGGDLIRDTNETMDIRPPHDNSRVVGLTSVAEEKHITAAIDSCVGASQSWARTPIAERLAVFAKAAQLLSQSEHRGWVLGATVLQQGMNYQQAQLDSICKTVDTLRYGVYQAAKFDALSLPSSHATWTNVIHRPLGGFVYCATPFNSNSKAVETLLAPVLMGNTVLWKPSSDASFPSMLLLNVLRDAGLPEGVINLVSGNSASIWKQCSQDSRLAGVSFSGSKDVFSKMQADVYSNISSYDRVPVLSGDHGGAGVIFADSDCDMRRFIVSLIRGAFEYSGQKTSSISRAYVPESMWGSVHETLSRVVPELLYPKVGSAEKVETFVSAVINRQKYNTCKRLIKDAKDSDDIEVVFGGEVNPTVGFFVDPTILLTHNSKQPLLYQDPLGPLLTICVYKDGKLLNAIKKCVHPNTKAYTAGEESPYIAPRSPSAISLYCTSRDTVRDAVDIIATQEEVKSIHLNDKCSELTPGVHNTFGQTSTVDHSGYASFTKWTSPLRKTEVFLSPSQILHSHME